MQLCLTQKRPKAGLGLQADTRKNQLIKFSQEAWLNPT